jgi:nucleoid-associated protein YgaU
MLRAGCALCLGAAVLLLGGCIREEQPPTATAIPVIATVPRPALASPSLPPSPSPSPLPAAQTYTVRSGDTLSSIAQMFYGDANEWRPIFEANRDLLPSADSLQAGQTLRIPPRPTTQTTGGQ